MIFSPHIWLKWAEFLMPKKQHVWLSAMRAELSHITSPAERQRFAIGCFVAALNAALKSRKGLNYTARIGGGFMILAMSSYGIISSAGLASAPETLVLSKIIIGLCLFYIGGAGLLIASLKGLKVYASTGFGCAAIGWIYCLAVRPKIDGVSAEFLTALNLEAAFLMASLFLASIYLNWLYSPENYDA